MMLLRTKTAFSTIGAHVFIFLMVCRASYTLCRSGQNETSQVKKDRWRVSRSLSKRLKTFFDAQLKNFFDKSWQAETFHRATNLDRPGDFSEALNSRLTCTCWSGEGFTTHACVGAIAAPFQAKAVFACEFLCCGLTKPRPLAVIRNRRLNSVALLAPLRSVQFSSGFSRVEEFTCKNCLRLKRCSNRTDMVNPSREPFATPACVSTCKMLNMPQKKGKCEHHWCHSYS